MENNVSPPTLARRLFEWYCNPAICEELAGDMEEAYHRRMAEEGKLKADLRYWLNVLMFFQPRFIRRGSAGHVMDMYGNYLKVALRSLTKQKGYAAINVASLLIGFAFCIMIWLYVQYELSFDGHFAEGRNIYRAWVKEDYGEGEQFFNTVTPIPLGPDLAATYPEVRAFTRFDMRSTVVKQGNRLLEGTMHFADEGFFDLFDTEVVSGEASVADLESIVLTESAAKKHFGSEGALGQYMTVQLGNRFEEFIVRGVVADQRATQSVQYDMLVNYEHFLDVVGPESRTNYFNIFSETYVLLQEGAWAADLEGRLPALVKRVLGEDYQPGSYVVGLQPLEDIHLNADIPAGIAPVSDAKYIYILSAVALLILLVACINFVTLAVGRSLSRVKEVGVRKSLGAMRGQIMSQFWAEALLTTFVALVAGIALAAILLPVFSELAGVKLSLELSVANILFILLLGGGTGLLAGSYPSLFLSRFHPAGIFHSGGGTGRNRELMRRLMVGFQFVLSILLILGTLTMQRQLAYLQNKHLGFEQEQLITVPQHMESKVFKDFEGYINEGLQRRNLLAEALASVSEVEVVGMSTHTFGQQGWTNIGWQDEKGVYEEITMNVVDSRFIDAYGIDIKAGRGFDEDNRAGLNYGVVVNEAFVKHFGIEDPAGAAMPRPFGDYTILGVARDFHYQSLHSPVMPALLVVSPMGLLKNITNLDFATNPNPKITLKLNTADLPATMDRIEKIWKETLRDQPFDYSFVDMTLASQYSQEKRLSRIMWLTTLLGIAISCMGLFGLVTLSLTKRTKEIGIRKVMGASSGQVMGMVYREFLLLIALSFGIAMPLAWFGMEHWLQEFAYRIGMDAGTYLLAGGIITAVASVTIFYHSWQAARNNPVYALRSE
ncbi:ABC transporter permease [Roseivirga sp. BDSF3-8]|uniref:ABC transporter permease n=1 Tax=Roseivirga sp. BDSF3-8 TaxID=3241598 RepID=UPI003531B71E